MNTETIALTFSIEKAPSGGYFMRMGQNPEQVDAAKSTLPEIMELIHARAQEKYQDPAWYGPQIVYRDRPIVPSVPQHQPAVEEPFEMPNGIRPHGGGLMEQFGSNGGLRALFPFLFVVAVTVSLWAVRLPA
jgi:hypothetical protein